MSLTIKAINADASFLLTFRPSVSQTSPSPLPSDSVDNFTILLDPWIAGPSTIWREEFATMSIITPACIKNLSELPVPDLVIISQPKSDHCHRQTLTQLPPRGSKTQILAEPAAAKEIRGWKHFDADHIHTLSKWDASRSRSNTTMYRIPVPGRLPNEEPGEVTVAFIPQNFDVTKLHNTIAITYRPPLPKTSAINIQKPVASPDFSGSPSSVQPSPESSRTLSVIFAPHGSEYKTLAPYITSHLLEESALPLTALLHCFDRVQNTWYMGGNICTGFPSGLGIAQRLRARVWISTHDADKERAGVANSRLMIDKYTDRVAKRAQLPDASDGDHSEGTATNSTTKSCTEAFILQSGQQLRLDANDLVLDSTAMPITSGSIAAPIVTETPIQYLPDPLAHIDVSLQDVSYLGCEKHVDTVSLTECPHVCG